MARVDFGISDEEFGRMSPAELSVFRDRLALRERRANARAALIVKALGVPDMSIEDIIAAVTALPDKPYVPTAAELEARAAKEREEFDRMLS